MVCGKPLEGHCFAPTVAVRLRHHYKIFIFHELLRFLVPRAPVRVFVPVWPIRRLVKPVLGSHKLVVNTMTAYYARNFRDAEPFDKVVGLVVSEALAWKVSA